MIKTGRFILIIVMVAALLATGCNLTPRIDPPEITAEPGTGDPQETPDAQETLEPSGTPIPTGDEAADPTDEPDPTDPATQEPDSTDMPTEAPTDAPTPTPTPTPKPTPTPAPTPTPTPEPPQSDFAAFSTTDILSGRTYTNAMFQNSGLTMINVWATWCGPCIAELPDIQRVQDHFGSRVQIVTILQDSRDALEGGRSIAEQLGLRIPVLVNNASVQAAIMTPYSVNALPYTFFVDSNGQILRTAQGSNDYNSWCSIINSLLG